MMKNSQTLLLLSIFGLFFSCEKEPVSKTSEMTQKEHKKVIYQVFTRLFGNENTNNKPWGTLEENGVGKFNDFTPKALAEIRELGVSHIWYTGVLHHAMVTDYSSYGISNDDPDIVKGRAGSPYAVKDYYSVDPDMAVDPSKRMEEFQALIDRTHEQNMKVIIDIVPNHIARKYEGMNNPEGISDFGAHDDTSQAYKKDNNFYYITGESFKVPNWKGDYQPLGGENHPLANGKFDENPAKWTGNGSRLAQPDQNDWYETVKINYGVRPDGTKDFDLLPEGFEEKNYEIHFEFWKDKKIPDTWRKFNDITSYWQDFGVDGFRFDMAEMVPVEFWSFLNSSIKIKNPETFILAEVYQPNLYRDYIKKGKMDYLYDKVQLYDSLKYVMQGYGSTDHIPHIQNELKDIEHHMLHFLENHDEQRIASPEFAGLAEKGKPAMVISSTISTAPTMIYFGQELGEPGAEEPGFGDPSRTSIYDYIGVPSLQRWVNNKNFDGGQSSENELVLRDFYKRLLNLSINSSALMGEYRDVHLYNREHTEWYNDRVLSFVRWSSDEKLVIVANFDAEQWFSFDLQIPDDIIDDWQLNDGNYSMKDLLYNDVETELKINNGTGKITVKLNPLESLILKVD